MDRRKRNLGIDGGSCSVYRRQKPVSAAGDGLNKTGILCAVAQGVPEPADGGVQTVVEVNKSVCGPQPALQFFPRHYFSRPFEQQSENLEGLFLQLHPGAVARSSPAR